METHFATSRSTTYRLRILIIRLREPFRPHPKAGLAHVARTKQISHTDDLRTQPPYLEHDPAVVAIADLAGARTIINVPMLKDEQPDRHHRHLSARRSGRSPTSRSNWSRISPSRPSSPSRTRGCSTSCANRCSSRPPPPTCSRSSAARPSTCRPCCRRSSNQPPGFAMLTVPQSRGRRTECSIAPRLMVFRLNSSSTFGMCRSSRNAGLPLDGPCWKVR